LFVHQTNLNKKLKENFKNKKLKHLLRAPVARVARRVRARAGEVQSCRVSQVPALPISLHIAESCRREILTCVVVKVGVPLWCPPLAVIHSPVDLTSRRIWDIRVALRLTRATTWKLRIRTCVPVVAYPINLHVFYGRFMNQYSSGFEEIRIPIIILLSMVTGPLNF